MTGQILEDLILRNEQHEEIFFTSIVREGTAAVVLVNGKIEDVFHPGKNHGVRLPFQKVETVMVDTRIRNLTIRPGTELFTSDHHRVSLSLSVSYQVTGLRTLVKYAEPVRSLYETVNNHLGLIMSSSPAASLFGEGRDLLRQELLNRAGQIEERLGIRLTEVNVDEFRFPGRVSAAIDERNAASLEGGAAGHRIQAKWAALPERTAQLHLEEQLAQRTHVVAMTPPASPIGALLTVSGGSPDPARHDSGPSFEVGRQQGRVKWFNHEKGFGFLSQQGGPDVFLHHSEIRGESSRMLKEGELVLFDIVDSRLGPRAANVTVV